MSKKDDYRGDMIDYISVFAKETQNDLIIQTSGSTIIGTPIDEEEKVNPIFDAMLKSFSDSRTKKIEEFKKDPEVLLSRRAIFLKDVSILGPSPLNLPFLIVFVDEISAVSFGNLD
ncbi:hypothetical protein FHO10_11465 [Enterococcus faecalis]|uniref:hypothetical protein n=1 Tax=Enterococcus faecalis TaxID=1351 RepID=UPI0011220F2C|nr:hypothetical protein [Enterococcus faecalis]MCD4905478.1 hypothetical protein [Enterococcus faecalis]QDB77168.1 hypothetical protein FHO10_11465 [Enterococcus faecalis]HAP3558618.1 hypothetical protein [Enterococcus faecalis]